MPYNPTEWINGVTPFNEDNMNKLEQAMNNRQLDTFRRLADIGLTDDRFDGMTELECAELLRDSMPAQSTLYLQCTASDNTILRNHFAPNGMSGYLIVRKYIASYAYFEYQAVQTTSGDDTKPSNRGNRSWISMFDDSNNTGNNRFSDWRQSGGISLIESVLAPGSTVTYQAVKTASAAIVHFRTSPDNENNRGCIVATRGRTAEQISTRLGTQNYYASASIDFNDGIIHNSSETDGDIRIDKIDLI